MTTTTFALIVLIPWNGSVMVSSHYATKEECEFVGRAAMEVAKTAKDYVCSPVDILPKGCREPGDICDPASFGLE